MFRGSFHLVHSSVVILTKDMYIITLDRSVPVIDAIFVVYLEGSTEHALHLQTIVQDARTASVRATAFG